MWLPDNAINKTLTSPNKAISWIRNNFIRATAEGLFTRFNSRFPFDHDWDVLIVLDGCRYDLGRKNSPTDWPSPNPVISPGWGSETWIQRTFDDANSDTLSNTIYVTGNPFSPLVENLPLQEIDQVWKYAFDENVGTTPPRPLTDRAIDYGRTGNPDRLVIHYMQPHLPHINGELNISLTGDGVGWSGGNPWVMIESNERNSQATVEAYKNNLSPVIKDVNLLLENIAAEKVVVTADHGNFLGENGNWGHHKRYARDPAVRQVPWWELSANDESTHISNDYDHQKDAVSRSDQLEALGYV